LSIQKSVTLLGPGPANLRIDGGGDSRAFLIFNGTTNTFSGITITNAHAANAATSLNGSHGGGIYNDGILTLSNCFIVGNSAGNGGTGSSASGADGGTGGIGGDGGGIYSPGKLSLFSCVVSNNSAGNGGRGGD